jgi:hypothetical protein
MEAIAMKVHIGSLEITVENLEELDQLVQRYGGEQPSHRAVDQPSENGSVQRANGGNSVAHDRVILGHLIEHADTGVHTNTLGDMLGRRGKAVKPALNQWAIKVRLMTEDGIDPFEKARPNGGRGWRLRATLLPIARQLLEEMK